MKKISKRLQSIISKITKKDNVIIDVGCDHCLTAINALKYANTKFAYNVDINKKPLDEGVNNLKKENLIEKTCNVVNDGLNKLEVKQNVDYCIISGLGGNTIVNILSNSTVENINEYILVPNDHPEVVRNYIKQNELKISYEEMIYESGFFYSLIQISKTGKKVKTYNDIHFGPINMKEKSETYVLYLTNLLKKTEYLYEHSKKSEYGELCSAIRLQLNNLSKVRKP
ncbi:MAG: class I SAM-dependent methyltransferase [Mycoplasmataceae bacterium]|jgi:tRNA (adenine22-N1)-methyltransferase|nr:class I SAM-dependent methyltransferase [Mycoplasmataceae bacterium]